MTCDICGATAPVSTKHVLSVLDFHGHLWHVCEDCCNIGDFKKGDRVQASHDGVNWYTGTFIAKHNGKFICQDTPCIYDAYSHIRRVSLVKKWQWTKRDAVYKKVCCGISKYMTEEEAEKEPLCIDKLEWTMREFEE